MKHGLGKVCIMTLVLALPALQAAAPAKMARAEYAVFAYAQGQGRESQSEIFASPQTEGPAPGGGQGTEGSGQGIEAGGEASTENSAGAPTEASGEASTEGGVGTSTEAGSEASTEGGAGQPTKTGSEQGTEAGTEQPAEKLTEGQTAPSLLEETSGEDGQEPSAEWPADDDFWAEWEDGSNDLPPAETESESETGLPVLADANGEMEAALYAPEGESFPPGTVFRLLTIADMVQDLQNSGQISSEEADQESRRLAQLLKSGWENYCAIKLEENDLEEIGLQEIDLEESDPEETGQSGAIRAFLPCYILVTDAEGGEIELPAGTELLLCFREKTIYEAAAEGYDSYRAAYHGRGDFFAEKEEITASRDDEEQLVQIRFLADGSGWYSVLQMEQDGQEEALVSEDDLVSLMALPSSGIPVSSAGSGFVKMNSSNVNGMYRSVRWYEGISSFVTFNSAGSNVKTIAYTLHDDAFVFYPLNNNAKGKFGGIYRKILFENGVWYDLKMTVIDYTNKTYAGTDGDAVSSYPPIGFGLDDIQFWFKPTMGEFAVRLEFYRNGDAAQTPVKLNTRFQWWEIDNNQRFGIRTENGSISTKYYQASDSTVYCATQAASVDGSNAYLFVTGPGEYGVDDKQGNVGFALTGCSTYDVVVGYRDHLRDDPASRVSKAKIAEWNDTLKGGSVSGIVLGMLFQSDVDIPIPPDTSYPQKYVSNSTSGWSAANTLPTAKSEYYYLIRQYVPWQTSANYYSAFNITDSLPAGVDYVGEPAVTRLEDNANLTGRFTVSANNDVITIAPAAALLNEASFYGYTYDIRLKVRMDPSEIKATYEGDVARYQVVNKATANMTFKNGKGSYRNDSNTVTTRASQIVFVHLRLTKEIDTGDIVWAHGNPTFTFQVSGEDVEKKKHTFYRMVEFTPDNVGSGAKASLTVDLRIPPGWYTAQEEKTMRYRLAKIYDLSGGNTTGELAVFDLSGGTGGAATFYNVKTTDEGESHSALARNVIGASSG